MISIYENDFLARNSRPFGINTIELRMMICMAIRDFHFARTQKQEKPLDFFEYVSNYIINIFNPKDKKVFKDILKLEIVNTEKLSFITPQGDLTPRGLMFIELNTRGSYIYNPSRNFEILFNNFVNAMQFPNEGYYYSPDMPTYASKEEEKPLVENNPELGDIHIKGEDFAAFLEAMKEKQLKEEKPKSSKRRVRESRKD